MTSAARAEGNAQSPRGASSRETLLLWLVFTAFAFAIYEPALRGPFHSDDLLYIGGNPWTEALTSERVLGILDPTGEARFYQSNYAPAHLLATAGQIQLFGADPFGYHVVNVLLHGLCAALLTALFAMTGISFAAAVVGGLVFLAHPANVEAVAWISQLKSCGSLALALGAILAFRRHPGTATVLFGLALLTKASALFALPVVAALVWIEDLGPERRARWGWIAGWTVLFALYGASQWTAFGAQGGVEVPAYADAFVHGRSIASIGLHYLVMAATAIGVAHAPEHPPVLSWLDPWWLAALPIGALLVWRIVVTLRSQSPEAAFWIGAAAGFAPVSQLVPFSHPMADRYLYFMLPGLIGGVLFALRSLPLPDRLARVGLVLGVGIAIVFGVQARARSGLWGEPRLLTFDSARNFPNGRTAAYLAAQRAAQRGEISTAVEKLHEAARLGRDAYAPLLSDPQLAPLYGDPEFKTLVDTLADRLIDRLTLPEHRLTQNDHATIAAAHAVRGRLDAAERSLEAGIAQGGPLTSRLEAELETLRRVRRDQAKSP